MITLGYFPNARPTVRKKFTKTQPLVHFGHSPNSHNVRRAAAAGQRHLDREHRQNHGQLPARAYGRPGQTASTPLGGPRTAEQEAANAQVLRDQGEVKSIASEFREQRAKEKRAAEAGQRHLNNEHVEYHDKSGKFTSKAKAVTIT